jgi:hypothetical protein
MTTADAHAKVLFRLPQDEDGYPPMDIEGVWASKNDDGSLTIDHIPFFTKEATLGDRVCAIARKGQLFYHSTIEHSGNSLLRVVFFEQSELPPLRSQLSSRGCTSELSHIDSLERITPTWAAFRHAACCVSSSETRAARAQARAPCSNLCQCAVACIAD